MKSCLTETDANQVSLLKKLLVLCGSPVWKVHSTKGSESTYLLCLWTQCDIIWRDKIGSACGPGMHIGIRRKVLLSISAVYKLDQNYQKLSWMVPSC